MVVLSCSSVATLCLLSFCSQSSHFLHVCSLCSSLTCWPALEGVSDLDLITLFGGLASHVGVKQLKCHA